MRRGRLCKMGGQERPQSNLTPQEAKNNAEQVVWSLYRVTGACRVDSAFVQPGQHTRAAGAGRDAGPDAAGTATAPAAAETDQPAGAAERHPAGTADPH